MEAYEKIKIIGRGAYGTVCLCERLLDRKQVIIKQIPVETMSKEERQAALNEVKVLEMLQHPNIVEYNENFLEDKALMIVMEYMEGGTLFDFLQQRNGQLLEEEDILRIFIQMLLSLQHVHSKQILHRDLKTQNILLNKSKTIVKIGDFGISKVLSSKSKAYSVVGTPCYISPELCEGKPYNQKSDIWALGCVLYELASLKKAFEAGNLFALISKIMRGNFAPISDQYSSELNKLIVNMLHLDPTKRPQINEIMCNPLVINSYMSYFADLGKVPVSNKVQRSISFSTDSPPATAASKNALQNGASSPGDATAKPSLKQAKHPSPSLAPRVGPPSSTIPLVSNGAPGVCPLDNIMTQSGYDITPQPLSIVYCWGGTLTFPTRLPLPNSDAEVVQVSVGRAQKAGVTKGGRVVLWDNGANGFAMGNTMDSSSIQSLLNSSTTSSLSSLSSLSNMSSLIGRGAEGSSILAKFLEGQAGVTIAKVACGDLFTACLTDRGILMTYGSGANGCLGHGNNNDVTQTKAKIVEALLGYEIVEVQTGSTHVLALTNEHEVYAWGRGENGRLGLGNQEGHSRPMPVVFPPPNCGSRASLVAASIFCGVDSSVVITTAGQMFCCGSNRSNKLGLDNPDLNQVVEEALTFEPLPSSSLLSERVITCVDIGTSHSAAITETGDLFTYGSNQFGQLSSLVSKLETPSHRRQRIPPTLVLRRCNHVSCGDTFTIASTTDGVVCSWGKGARGRLGRQINGDSTDPVPVDLRQGEPPFDVLSLVSSHGTTLMAVKPRDDVSFV